MTVLASVWVMRRVRAARPPPPTEAKLVTRTLVDPVFGFTKKVNARGTETARKSRMSFFPVLTVSAESIVMGSLKEEKLLSPIRKVESEGELRTLLRSLRLDSLSLCDFGAWTGVMVRVA